LPFLLPLRFPPATGVKARPPILQEASRASVPAAPTEVLVVGVVVPAVPEDLVADPADPADLVADRPDPPRWKSFLCGAVPSRERRRSPVSSLRSEALE
jgi:hypothetical protein